MFRILSGIFMGWSLGSNDSANIFGTAVFSKMVRYRTAVILCAVFVLLGALLEGSEGMHTLGGLVENQNMDSAFVASLVAALSVTFMTALKLPVSTSQAMVGAIIGIGLAIGNVNLDGFQKVVYCWVGTPIGTIVATITLYAILGNILEILPINIFTRDSLLRAGLIIAGCYGAYSLGANNVANVTGIYVQTGLLDVFQASLIGGISIGLGAVTYSKKVMMTVGEKLVKLDPFSAFIAVLSCAIVVHIYAKVGVPVSTSQAIIGSVIGIGLIKGVKTINKKVLGEIVLAWLGSPLIAAIVSYTVYSLVF